MVCKRCRQRKGSSPDMYFALIYINQKCTDGAFCLAHANFLWCTRCIGTFRRCVYRRGIGSFLKQLGCSFALVGHSERRANFNETTEISAQKIDQCILNKIDPILCLGESTKVDDQTSAEEVALELKNCINQTTTLNSPNPHSTDVRNNNLHDVKTAISILPMNPSGL